MTTAIETNERPILFSGAMVRAILDGKKTQTRRVVKPQPPADWVPSPWPYDGAAWSDRRCPYGAPGDRLWVRETWAPISPDEERRPIRECRIEYRADTSAARPGGWDEDTDDPEAARWRPSIHMPRWASRLTLEVTGVRVERVQDISEDDARAEGVYPYADNPRRFFQELWNSINGARGYGWNSNPWVWVVEFRRVAP